MQGQDLIMAAALRDFREARRQAALEDLKARLTGRSDDLLSYEDVRRLLKPDRMSRQGLQEIPLDAIVGSVGRYNDFTRSFLPRRDSNRERWAKIKLKATYEGGLPPIEVYKVGQAYFVLDGNHRVSVLRQLGGTHIQAYVTEVHTRVSLAADITPDELIVKARYAEFLEQTNMDRSRPQADLIVTAPGQYRVLEEQIRLFQQHMMDREGRPVSLSEAAIEWYDDEYRPAMESIRGLGLLSEFPGRTETDLYVWVSRHQEALEQELGWEVRPQAAVADLAAQRRPRIQSLLARLADQVIEAVVPNELEPGPPPGQWRRMRQASRANGPIFPEVLVPISGTERGWIALDQAMVVAGREGATLRGFHVVRSAADLHSERLEAVRSQFNLRCQQAEIAGELFVEVGPVARTICERARWTDLVVANLAWPPRSGPVKKLSSGFHTMIRRCSRPILAVPRVSPLSRALLAFDGSVKAREALFVAACIAGRWQVPLTVATVIEDGRTTSDTLETARNYLQAHGVEATYVEEHGSVARAILNAAQAQESDLIIMGGYGFSPVLEMVLGSAIDQMLRESTCPMLICQ